VACKRRYLDAARRKGLSAADGAAGDMRALLQALPAHCVNERLFLQVTAALITRPRH
jgi:hypothetical protein